MIKGIKNMDEIHEEGGSAFPVSERVETSPGMTLRDWFAGQVAGGSLALPENCYMSPETIAVHAYQVADAMLEARK